MLTEQSIQPGVYELPLIRELPADTPINGSEQSLPQPLLIENTLWFCRFRWLVIAVLVSYGIFGLFPRSTGYFGLRSPASWAFCVAFVLTLINIVFLLLARARTSPTAIMCNLWAQITTDLLVLTVVVYFVGSLHTNIAFAYLFHIVLACMFLSRRQSLIVTVLAIAFFAASIIAEYALRILPPMSIFETSTADTPTTFPRLALNFLFAVGIWLVIWYLASGLSSIVRHRDLELARTNRRLVAAHEERSRHMLTTTHQLKAPFAAIYSNAQLLEQGRRLAAEIQEMLQLANLGSASIQALPRTRIVSTELLMWCISQVEPVAREHGVVFETSFKPAVIVGAEDHLKMLFVNLLSNAVIYSHEGGRVRISCSQGPDSQAAVTIADEGIGIPAEKLPHIFEEHYRTKEAVRHNKESSGLGLAIVGYVAQMYGIRIRVESSPGLGTKFHLDFPAPNEIPTQQQ